MKLIPLAVQSTSGTVKKHKPIKNKGEKALRACAASLRAAWVSRGCCVHMQVLANSLSD